MAPPAFVPLDLGVPDRVLGRCVRVCLLGGSAAASRGSGGLGNERCSCDSGCRYGRDNWRDEEILFCMYILERSL